MFRRCSSFVLLVGSLAQCSGTSDRSADTPTRERNAATAIAPRVLVVTSSARCPGVAVQNIAGFSAENQRHLIRSLAGRAAEIVDLPEPTPKQVEEEVRREGKEPLLFFYSGHGCVRNPGTSKNRGNESCLPKPKPSGRSALCLGERQAPLSVDDILSFIPESRPWAVLVVNACHSAYLDVRRAKVPVSVISASPREVQAGEFARNAGDALADSSSDKNCDGIVSDEELLEHIDDRSGTDASRVNFDPTAPDPKLRRQAWPELPILRAPFRSTSCPDVASLRSLADRMRSTAPDLATAITAQVELVTNSHVALPRLEHDYHFSRRGLPDWIETVFEDAGIRRFPGSAGDAELLARFALFTDVYVAEWTDPYLEVTRLRGRLHRTLEGDQQTLPPALRGKLGAWGFSLGVNDELVARFKKSVPKDLPPTAGISANGLAVPCRLQMGQCFESAGPPNRALATPRAPANKP